MTVNDEAGVSYSGPMAELTDAYQRRSVARVAEPSRTGVRGSRGSQHYYDSRYQDRPNFRGGRTYAALDLGTNNCRLLVAEPTFDNFRVVDAFSRTVRLGEGMASVNRLGDEAIARAIEALKICRAKMDARRVGRARLIATEACRAAINGQDFINRVEAETGLILEVVDRETEALLAVSGCAGLTDPAADSVVVFDIGGGSSEIVWTSKSLESGNSGSYYAHQNSAQHNSARNNEHSRASVVNDHSAPTSNRRDSSHCVRAWASLPLGVVTLAERFGGVEVTPDVFAAMVQEVERQLTPFAWRARHASRMQGFHLLGTSGTVTTIAGVHLNLPRYDRRQVDGLWMDDCDVAKVIASLADCSYAERVANPCIGTDRADLVLAGCAILEAIRRAFPSPRLRVADRGLREGILLNMMREDNVWNRRPKA